jgi:hypothetical protein
MKIIEQQTVRCCPCPECQLQPTGKLAEQHRAINRMVASLNERSRRLVVGFLAQHSGRGGLARVAQRHKATGVPRSRGGRGHPGGSAVKQARQGLDTSRRIGPGTPGPNERPNRWTKTTRNPGGWVPNDPDSGAKGQAHRCRAGAPDSVA